MRRNSAPGVRLARFAIANLLVLLLYLPWLGSMLNRFSVDNSYWQGRLKVLEALRTLFISFVTGESVDQDVAVWLLLLYAAHGPDCCRVARSVRRRWPPSTDVRPALALRSHRRGAALDLLRTQVQRPLRHGRVARIAVDLGRRVWDDDRRSKIEEQELDILNVERASKPRSPIPNPYSPISPSPCSPPVSSTPTSTGSPIRTFARISGER